MNEFYDAVEKFVDDSFAAIGDTTAPKHLARTVYWLEQLKPDANEALKIAARAHDIECAFRQDDMLKLLKESSDGFGDKTFLKQHQTRGAEIIADFLRQQNAPTETIDKVRELVAHHEKGGSADQNILQDADTISFFENNITHFIEKRAPIYGPEKVAAKFKWMFERLNSEKAKEIVKPWYQAAMEKLKTIN